MKPVAFETIAKPHRDILRGLFTADTYAAKLGQVVKNQGPSEYKNAQQFFQKTYLTDGLKGLISGIEGRLKGRDRQNQDPILQLQTPFGGGKTHTLIALYHKAKEWNATPVAIVGSEIDTTDTFWGEIERQLTGRITHFGTQIRPGGNSIAELFKKSSRPVLILMDEVLHYLTSAAGIAVEGSTLAEQSIAFMLSLTEAVAASPHVVFVVTLQESEVAPLESRFPLFRDLLKRMSRTITPVNDAEIASVIRHRLFSKDDFKHTEAKKIVRDFARHARKEGILPTGTQESEYRERFLASYPFLPEVIEVLYHRWGSFPNFQRTRGVLRLLARVVNRACGKQRPYLTLADFDLSDTDIREELLEHIDAQYKSVIASDITGYNAGAKAADNALGDTYEKLALGSRTATTIFLYSFTGGVERGASSEEIKRSTVPVDQPAAIIDSAKSQLAEHLFYLRTENGTAYFDTQPNLKRIVRTRMENLAPEDIAKRMHAQLQRLTATSAKMQTYISPTKSTDIPDTEVLKLVVLSKQDDALCQRLSESRGDKPRIYRNTLFFLVPVSGTPEQLEEKTKEVLAYEEIKKDKALNLSATQRQEINNTLKQSRDALKAAARQDYRMVLIPTRDGFDTEDLGLPASGMDKPLDEDIYEMLCMKEHVLTSIGPRNLSIRYLDQNERELLPTAQLFHTSLRAPGEQRVLRDAWVASIKEGVEKGFFALGEKTADKLIPGTFRELPSEVTLEDSEVIMKPHLIRERITTEDILREYLGDTDAISTSHPFSYASGGDNCARPLRSVWEAAIREGVESGVFGLGENIGDTFVPRAFREKCPPLTFADNELILAASLCTGLVVEPPDRGGVRGTTDVNTSPPPEPSPPPTPVLTKTEIGIRFTLPSGKVSDVLQLLHHLQSSFQDVQIQLHASDGEISEGAYEEFKEQLRALGIEVEEV